MSDSRLPARLIAATVATLVATAIAYAVWHLIHRASSMTIEVDPGTEPEELWDGQEFLVADPVAGFRPRRSCTQTHPMAALDKTTPDEIVKRRDAHGFLRDIALPATLTEPRVLVLGDSHVDGVVNTADNFASLLEARATTDGVPTWYLNAGCALYGLWQDVLRARDLLPRFEPRLVVIVVFLGNDFIDLENPRVPHLDDELRELPAATIRPPETTTARRKELALPGQFEHLFWQGLNQALYLHREPARIAILGRKADHAVGAMEAAAAAHGSRVLWVLLPSFDLVFPDAVRGFGGLAAEVADGGAQQRMRDAFVDVLDERHAMRVDLEPAFRTDGRLGLYAVDFHIYRAGHRLLADTIAPVIDALLAGR